MAASQVAARRAAVALLLAALSAAVGTSFAMQQQQQQSAASDVQFSCGKLFYRTFYLDATRDVLYVGAMDNIFRLSLANINATNCADDAIRLEPSDAHKCVSKGKSEHYDCRNHIKVIQPMGKSSDKLYVCGTNAYNPRDYLLAGSNLSVAVGEPMQGVGSNAQAECPFDPDDNSTAVWVERGNPSDLPALYSGTVTEMSKADAIIFRSELYSPTSGVKVHEAKRTAKYDSKWLDKPNFVGSFELGDYVYFFFRESAVEYINCGKSIYSRVARVCKRDNGFKPSMYEKIWTTFLKARLNCSLPGEFPFYFDEIQSIVRNPLDERKFHAVFTTSNNGLSGSAVCTFSLDAIHEAFNGKFKEQRTSAEAWLPVPSFRLNATEPRPGTCVDDSLALSDTLVNFVRGHPLMDSAVANDNGKPVFYRRATIFTKLVVDVVEVDGVRYTVYFIGTNTGHVYKIVEWLPGASQAAAAAALSGFGGDSSGFESQQFGNSQSSSSASSQSSSSSLSQVQTQSALVEIIDAVSPQPVRAMEISARHKSLYVASDSQVRQINLQNCRARHDNCVQCVRDPYCGWDRRALECRSFERHSSGSLIQDVANEQPDVCHAAAKHKDVHATWGQAVHLPCPISHTLVQEHAEAIAQQQRLQFASGGVGVGDGIDGAALFVAPPNHFVSWHYHRRQDNVIAPGFPLLQRRDKFVLAADQGLVILSATESGSYVCRLGTQLVHRYNLMVDTKTCAAPSEQDFKFAYANWCREFEKYKSVAKSWHAKQNKHVDLQARNYYRRLAAECD